MKHRAFDSLRGTARPNVQHTFAIWGTIPPEPFTFTPDKGIRKGAARHG